MNQIPLICKEVCSFQGNHLLAETHRPLEASYGTCISTVLGIVSRQACTEGLCVQCMWHYWLYISVDVVSSL